MMRGELGDAYVEILRTCYDGRVPGGADLVTYWFEKARALAGLTHYIATPETAKHRFFVTFPVTVAPEHSLIVIPRQDDTPEGWLDWEVSPEEQAADLPSRPIPKPEHAAAWKKRTLTNLYNEMPSGLKLHHETLDKAVAAAYGWNDYTPEMPNETILVRLLALNLERSEKK